MQIPIHNNKKSLSQVSLNTTQAKSFGALYISEPEVQRLVIKNLNPKDFEKLKNLTRENLKNPVDAFISSKNGRTLTAKIYCPYFIKNFKEYYKQVPFFESKIAFISRIAKKINEYKNTIENSLKTQ